MRSEEGESQSVGFLLSEVQRKAEEGKVSQKKYMGRQVSQALIRTSGIRVFDCAEKENATGLTAPSGRFT